MQGTHARGIHVIERETQRISIRATSGSDFLRARLKAPATGMHYMSNEEALSLGLYVINERTGELISPEFANAQPHR